MTDYFDSADLKNFAKISEHAPDSAKAFFDYYGKITGSDGALSKREKALIALAVSHSEQCPYCIDAYSTACLEAGANPDQMMEAVHVAAAMKAGITMVHATQMQKHINKMVL